jgi:threonylcarbamoyladenosine tRNA methylthiotransferase MtaB
MAPDLVMDNLHQLKTAGFREVVLSGIHLGCYGRDFSSGIKKLIDLLKRIEAENTVDRIRLSSIEPLELSEEIIRLVAASNRICHHFHIPLQSGDNLILKAMKRPYNGKQFQGLVRSINKIIPNAAIGTDVLVGFPGETDQAFQNTCSLIEALPVSYLHAFPFSPRKGTPAHGFSNQVPADVKKNRSRKILDLGRRKKIDFYEAFLGNTLEVLIEETRDADTGHLKGLTSNYISVLTTGPDTLQNNIVPVRLDRLHGPNAVFGTIC